MSKKTKASTSQPVSSPRSAETTARNDDLLAEILLRLPIKSLIKFKCVSKRWLSLISDPVFSHRRSSSPVSASGLFIRRFRYGTTEFLRREVDSVSITSASVPPFRPSTFAARRRASYVDVAQSCNGLLLCSHEARRRHYVYNPTTKQYATLPRLPVSDHVHCLALAFDPSESPHYKVVCVTSSDPMRRHLRFSVYSSAAPGSWRPTRASLANDLELELGRGGVFCDGSVHWLSSYCFTSSSRETAPYFHVATEEIRQMPMPPLREMNYSGSYFGASGNRLHVADHMFDPVGFANFDVFELERDYSKWAVKYRVDISGVLRAFPEMIPGHVCGEGYMRDYNMSVISVVRCEVEEDSFVVMNIATTKMVGYNFRTGSFRKLCDVEPYHYQYIIDDEIVDNMPLEPFHAYPYIESLASV